MRNPNVDTFFEQNVSKEEFAHYMRKFMHAGIMLSFTEDGENYKNDLGEGYYWLTQFVEQIDPVLEKTA